MIAILVCEDDHSMFSNFKAEITGYLMRVVTSAMLKTLLL